MLPPVIDKMLQSVDLKKNLLPFLRYSGWVDSPEKNKNWIVLHGEMDIYGHPIELVFPNESNSYEEKQSYIIKAVALITALKKQPMQIVLQSIISYDRDLFYVRNLETNDNNAIVLQLAVSQINNIKSTLEYSASLEKNAKPYFVNVNSSARKIVNNFLFGHTFAGSFGFTVETPRLPEPLKFIQKRLPFEEEEDMSLVNIPYERRIMERVARGLTYTKEAEEARNHNILINEYPSGFNSNMCSSVIGILNNKRTDVEFRITWSPKVKPSEDVEGLQPIKIKENGYEILDYAAKELKKRTPEFITISGHVKALTSSDNPLNLGTRRAVVIRTLLPNTNRESNVIIELERDDYAKANKAHIKWQNIQVSGILSRSGTGWRLLNVQGFKILT